VLTLINSSYSGSPEILGYFKEVVATHGLARFAKLNHRVLGAWWNDESGKWKIKVQPGDSPEDSFFDTGDILINATGVLK
jgi:cation diffusion facilitator CzcD-associated flavoprotein CzcO